MELLEVIVLEPNAFLGSEHNLKFHISSKVAVPFQNECPHIFTFLVQIGFHDLYDLN